MAVVYEGLRLPVPEGTSPILAELMKDCWQVDPAKRPTFKGKQTNPLPISIPSAPTNHYL